MELNPDEWRVARLLRELIAQSGVPPEVLERRLGWEPGWLAACLEGRRRLGFDDVSRLLPLLGVPASEFLTGLSGLEAGEAAVALTASDAQMQRAKGRRFDRSLRVVRNAIARRSAWNRGGTDET